MQFVWPADELYLAFLCALAAPVVLFASQWFIENVSIRYITMVIATLGTYIFIIGFLYVKPFFTIQCVSGLAFLISVCIFILGFWGLLTRGFSVAMLLSLEKNDGAETETLHSGYANGMGLHWFLEKRLAGMRAIGVVVESEGSVKITPILGILALQSYRLFKKLFKLQQYG